GRGGGAGGAVPHRTYPGGNAPCVPPGSYTVKLTVGGKSETEPLTLHLDPRVKTSALALETLNRLTRQMYDGSKTAHAAAEDVRALTAKLDASQAPQAAALKEKLAALAPAGPVGGRGAGATGRGGGGRGGPGAAQNAQLNPLDTLATQMIAAAMSMQNADVAPTAREVAACAEAQRQFTAIIAKWTEIKAEAA